jgi:hypothetical protein
MILDFSLLCGHLQGHFRGEILMNLVFSDWSEGATPLQIYSTAQSSLEQ